MWNDDSGETCDIIRNTTTSVKSRRPWTSTKMHTYARLLGVWNLEKPECEQKWRKEKTKKYTDHWRHKDDIRLEVVAAGRGALFVVGSWGQWGGGGWYRRQGHFLSRLATERARVLRNLARLRCVRGVARLRMLARRVLLSCLYHPRAFHHWPSRFDRAVSVVVVVVVMSDRIVCLRCVIIRGMELKTHLLSCPKRPRQSLGTVRLSSNTKNIWVSFLAINKISQYSGTENK